MDELHISSAGRHPSTHDVFIYLSMLVQTYMHAYIKLYTFCDHYIQIFHKMFWTVFQFHCLLFRDHFSIFSHLLHSMTIPWMKRNIQLLSGKAWSVLHYFYYYSLLLWWSSLSSSPLSSSLYSQNMLTVWKKGTGEMEVKFSEVELLLWLSFEPSSVVGFSFNLCQPWGDMCTSVCRKQLDVVPSKDLSKVLCMQCRHGCLLSN